MLTDHQWFRITADPQWYRPLADGGIFFSGIPRILKTVVKMEDVSDGYTHPPAGWRCLRLSDEENVLEWEATAPEKRGALIGIANAGNQE
jgi:hypothetical protein